MNVANTNKKKYYPVFKHGYKQFMSKYFKTTNHKNTMQVATDFYLNRR